MGQENSKTESSFKDNFKIIKKVQDRQNGEFLIVEDLNTKEVLMGQEYSYTNETDFKNSLQNFENLKKFNSQNIVTIKQIHSRIQNEFCSKFYKIYLLTESYDTILHEEFSKRMNEKKNYTELELRLFLNDISQGLVDLKAVDVSHQDIRPNSICVSQENYKIGDPRVFRQSNAYMQVYTNRTNKSQGIYLSPKQLDGLYSNLFSPEDDSYKSDVFSLGMITLMLGNLNSIDHLYDYEQAAINGNALDDQIDEFGQKYSPELTNLVIKMLDENEVNRLSAQEVNIEVNKQKSSPNPTPPKTNFSPINPERTDRNNFENNTIADERKIQNFGNNYTTSSYQPTIGKEPFVGAHVPNSNIGVNNLSHGNPEFKRDEFRAPEKIRVDTISNPNVGEKLNFNNPMVPTNNLPSNFNQDSRQNINSYLGNYQPQNHTSFGPSQPPVQNPPSNIQPAMNETKSDYNQRRVDEIIESIKRRTQEMKGELGVKEEPKNVDNYKLPSFNFQQTNQTISSQQSQREEVNPFKPPQRDFVQSLERNDNQIPISNTINNGLQKNPENLKWEDNWQFNRDSYGREKPLNDSFQTFSLQGNNYRESEHSQTQKIVDNSYLNKEKPNTISDYFHPRESTGDNKKVVEIYPNGSRYEGFKLNGLRHGHGILFYVDGGFYDGEWKFNKMNGKGKLFYINGQLAYDGDWVDDKFEGQGILYNEEPEIFNYSFPFEDFNELDEKWMKYEGYFKDDNKHGKGKLFLSNGEVLEGFFKEDLVDGECTFFMMNGDVVQGKWVQNQLLMRYD